MKQPKGQTAYSLGEYGCGQMGSRMVVEGVGRMLSSTYADQLLTRPAGLLLSHDIIFPACLLYNYDVFRNFIYMMFLV